MELPFELLRAGYCTAGRHHALRGAERKMIRFYATFGLWKHPSRGYVLFDTGYTRRFYAETKSFPAKLYARMTNVVIAGEEEAVAVLRSKGIHRDEIGHIVISHFHADHIGGLRDFPGAKLHCTREAFEHVRGKKGFSAVKRGYLPGLLPVDIEERLQPVDFSAATRSDAVLGPLVDLFSDGSILICALPGHARGQIGALFRSAGRDYFLASDAAWLEESYRNFHLPHPMVRLIFDSWADFKESLKKVHDYHRKFPDTMIIPCHCNQARLAYERHG